MRMPNPVDVQRRNVVQVWFRSLNEELFNVETARVAGKAYLHGQPVGFVAPYRILDNALLVEHRCLAVDHSKKVDFALTCREQIDADALLHLVMG